MIKISIIYLFFLIFIFFLYGLVLSETIDYIFPLYDEDIHDYRMGIEMICELGIAYIIYFSLQYYLESFIKILYKRLSIVQPEYLNKLLLIAFSTGIFKHLQKSNNKIVYIREKYLPKQINNVFNIFYKK